MTTSQGAPDIDSDPGILRPVPGTPALRRPAWLSDRVALRLSLAIWIISVLVIAALVAHDPGKRTVTDPYHAAANAWWAGGSIYTGPQGMNYFPHFAVLFTPITWIPMPWGEVLWRIVCGSLLGAGAWSLSGLLARGMAVARGGAGPTDAPTAAPAAGSVGPVPNRSLPFLLLTLLTLPMSLAAVRSGQANAPFAGVLALIVGALGSGLRWRAAGWMFVAAVLKPLALPLIMLTPLAFRRTLVPVLVAGAAFAAAPFAFAPPTEVIGHWRELAINLQQCATITEHRFASIDGIARSMGYEFSEGPATPIRLAAAALLAGMVWLWLPRMAPTVRGVTLLLAATSYLMVFNPMNEVNSYVIFALPASAIAIWCHWADRHLVTGWVIAAMLFSVPIVHNIAIPMGRRVDMWWPPVVAIITLGWILTLAARGRLRGVVG